MLECYSLVLIRDNVMAFPRQKFREIVLQLLSCDSCMDVGENEVIAFIMKLLLVTKKIVKEAMAYKEKIKEQLSQIDQRIQKTSISYSFERISFVELNILRLGIYEMIFEEDIPSKVAIAEAIRLCRKFSTPQSANFVNAIMDQNREEKIVDEVVATE